MGFWGKFKHHNEFGKTMVHRTEFRKYMEILCYHPCPDFLEDPMNLNEENEDSFEDRPYSDDDDLDAPELDFDQEKKKKKKKKRSKRNKQNREDSLEEIE